MRKRKRIIYADKILKRAGFKMPSKEVLAMQGELLEGERIARRAGQMPKIPNPLEMERAADRFRKNALVAMR